MRVGISIGTGFSTEGQNGHRAGAGYVLGQARAARRGGLDSLTVGDHHTTGTGGYLQNTPTLGRLAAEWSERQMGCLFLVPLWNPVLMAEQIGTLASMSSGPFIVQTGLGGGERDFRAMGVDFGQRVRLLEEGIRVVQALLQGDSVDSEIFDVNRARVAPLPPAGTEWWVGGGVPTAIDRAARMGDCWYGNADLTPDTAARDMAIYRDACARHDREPIRIPIRKDVLISENRSEAVRVGDSLVEAGYRGFDRKAVAYGDPESVAEQLSVFGSLGFTDIIIRTMSPLPETLGPDAAHKSVELAGKVQSLLS